MENNFDEWIEFFKSYKPAEYGICRSDADKAYQDLVAWQGYRAETRHELDALFYWGDSSEGGIFWSKIYEKITAGKIIGL